MKASKLSEFLYSMCSLIHFDFFYRKRIDREMEPPFTLRKFSPTIEIILKYAEDLDIDLNIVDDFEKTPLCYLDRERDEECVRQFLEVVRNEFDIELNR